MAKVSSGGGGKGGKKGAGKKPKARPTRAGPGILAVIRASGVKLASKGEGVKAVQSYLQRFGYLTTSPDPAAAMARGMGPINLLAADGEFDDATETAIRLFQRNHELPLTGQLDGATVAQMAQPRCGVPDVAAAAGGPMSFAVGVRWPQTKITYSFENFSSDPSLSQSDVKKAIRTAFDLWSNETPLVFTEVSSQGDIKIAFRAGVHGDGFPFDGRLGELAHAFPPVIGAGAIAGDTHFDEGENWSIDLPEISAGAVDLITVAAHEFGHALGLDHSPHRGTLMFASYSGAHRFLSSDDVVRIQSLYGGPP
jgi:hypothetical protein